MGTRSTVKFFTEEGKNVLSVYQQYDGYPEGVGRRIGNLIENIKITNGFGFDDRIYNSANGIEDLALQYIAKYKTEIGNLYATTIDDEQDYNYEITQTENDLKIKVYCYDEKERPLFEGNRKEFIMYLKYLDIKDEE